MSILKRPPGDQFSFRLFFQLCNTVEKSKDVFYLWSNCIDPYYNKISHFLGDQEFYENEILYRNYITDGVKHDIIILGIKDHLTSNNFNPWQETMPNMIEWIKQLAEYYKEKTIVLFTSLENLEYYIKDTNIKIVPWGGDITNHQKEYAQLDPILDKNFKSRTTFLSLNRNQRAHRAMLLALLYKLDIQDHGLISCMFKDQINDLFRYTQWNTDKQLIFEEGFTSFKQHPLVIQDNYNIYNLLPNDNVTNFKNKLSTYYRDTFVEIITETSYTEACYNLTEKTLNSIYGCCFPILLCSQGSVQFLRDMGIDVFDDIVDHSYDSIADPTDRLYHAVVDNIRLLTDLEFVKNQWKSNRSRFVNNIDFVKDKMYNFYRSRATTSFEQIKNEHNL